MNQNKQRALFFTVLIIVYTLFDYFILRGHPAEDSADVPPVQAQPAPMIEKP